MEYWKHHDSKMLELKKIYNKQNKQTQNRLQELLDTFNIDIDNLYNIADNQTKNKINIYIEQWKDQGLLNGYFGMLAKNIYNRTRVKNNEILELIIYSAYIEEQSKLDEIEQKVMYEDTNYYYQEGIKEVNKTLNNKKPISAIDMALFLYLLEQPTYNGLNWKQYIQTTTQYNAQQLYKQVIINIQQQKELKVDSNEFQRIIQQQNKQKLNINNDKISGAVDMQMIGLNNQAKVEGIKTVTEDNSKVRFIAVTDSNSTEMCQSMDNMEFYINKENRFQRMWGETQKELRMMPVRVQGLVLGVNLPPIVHHFHYCRSTIMYFNNRESKVDISEDEDILQYFDFNNFIKRDITNQKYELINTSFKNNEIKKIALNNNIKSIYIYGKKSKHKKNEIYLNAEWKRKSKKSQERTIRHEVGHAIDYKNKYISCNGELTTALEIDKQNIIKHKESIKTMLRSRQYENYAELSDILGGLTNNEVRGKYKHRNSYWKKEGALEKETFANLFAIAGGNDIEYLKVISKYLPNTLMAFDGLIGRIK